MTATREGGKLAAQKNLARNPNHFREIGKLGGSKRVPKGFAMDRELASEAGRRGGTISRRGKAWEHSTSTPSDSSTQTTMQSQKQSSASSESEREKLLAGIRRRLGR